MSELFHPYKCSHCGNPKHLKEMHNQKLCIACFADKPKSRTTAHNEFRHSVMREYGLICLYCNEMRGYEDFKKNKASKRAMVKKPCVFCRERGVRDKDQKTNTKVRATPPTIIKNPNRERKTCATCAGTYDANEMYRHEKDLCVYCVVIRNKKDDIVKLKNIMRNDNDVCRKIVNYIQKNYENIIPSK